QSPSLWRSISRHFSYAVLASSFKASITALIDSVMSSGESALITRLVNVYAASSTDRDASYNASNASISNSFGDLLMSSMLIDARSFVLYRLRRIQSEASSMAVYLYFLEETR